MSSSIGHDFPAISEAVDRARAKAGYSREAFAYILGILPSQWSRQLRGQEHIALDRLAAAPDEFRRALIEELEMAWGIETTLETVQRELGYLRDLILATQKKGGHALNVAAPDSAGHAGGATCQTRTV